MGRAGMAKKAGAKAAGAGGTRGGRAAKPKAAPKAAPKAGGKQAAGKQAAGRAAAAGDAARWTVLALGAILAATAFRLGVNALGLVPVHFDEAQYWAYGQELDWGYFSKPPLVGAVIRVTTDLGGDTLFWMRAASPVAHGVIAGLLFLLGQRFFDARTGFWGAAAYLAAPGVTASAMIMSTDPVMMAFWALALLAWFRAMETGRAGDWALMGAAIGLGTLAKYTMLVMPVAALGYGLFSARGRDLRGMGIAAGVALAVLAPNLMWVAENDFVTATHIAEDADPGRGYFNPGKLAEFAAAQLGVIGPVVFLAILAAFVWRREWAGDWRMRALAWQAGLLLFAMLGLSFLTRAQPNWAAPAYVAGALFAARWLLERGWTRALKAQLWIGGAAAAALYGLAVTYANNAESLPRWADPFKKMRLSEPFCDLVLASMAEEGAQAILSDDRRRLSECMFLGGLTWDEVAVWNPGLIPRNHHELVATLREGDQRDLLVAVQKGGADIAARFDEAREVDAGEFAVHADRSFTYELWIVRGFRGYGVEY